jgi:hypothetical protein
MVDYTDINEIRTPAEKAAVALQNAAAERTRTMIQGGSWDHDSKEFSFRVFYSYMAVDEIQVMIPKILVEVKRLLLPSETFEFHVFTNRAAASVGELSFVLPTGPKSEEALAWLIANPGHRQFILSIGENISTFTTHEDSPFPTYQWTIEGGRNTLRRYSRIGR